MSELLQIQQYLSARGLAYVVPRMLNPSSPVLILEVPRDRMGDTASKEKTSRRQLSFVSKSLEKKHGKRVIVTLRDAQALDDIAVSVRAVLKHEFPALVSDVHVSFATSTAAVVWVESLTLIDENATAQLQASAKRALAEFGVKCQAFDIVAPLLPEPSTTAILRAVKVHAPASLATVNQDLLRRGFACPSEKWLSYKLDVARKRGLVLRDQDGRFILTANRLLKKSNRTHSWRSNTQPSCTEVRGDAWWRPDPIDDVQLRLAGAAGAARSSPSHRARHGGCGVAADVA